MNIQFHPNKRIYLNSNNENLFWLPVFKIHFRDDYYRIVGINSKNNWMMTVSRAKKVICEEVIIKEDCFHLITLLEKDRESIELELINGLKKNNLPKSLFDLFPFKDLIKYTLTNGSCYWVGKASFWLRIEDFDKEIISIVNEIIRHKKFTQEIRHRLFRLLKQFERL